MSEGDPTDGEPSAPPRGSWFQRLRARKLSAVVAIGIALAAFAGGAVTTQALGGLDFLKDKHANTAAEPTSLWSLFGKPRRADAPRRGVPKPEGFAVWRSRIDSSGPEPLACIELSRPLDPERAYGDFVLVSPDPGTKPAVVVKGTELCIAGLGFADRSITLLKGLPARSGETTSRRTSTAPSTTRSPPGRPWPTPSTCRPSLPSPRSAPPPSRPGWPAPA